MLQKNLLFRLKLMLSKTKDTIDAYIRRSEKTGDIEGMTIEDFQIMKERIEELEGMING